MTAEPLTFDAATHRYTKGERRVYSVTQVIDRGGLGADFSMVPEARMREATQRGRWVHDAVQFLDEGDLDDATVPGHIAGYVEAYRSFRGDTGYEPIACEVRLYSPTYGYAGTPDKIGWLGPWRILLDVKTPLSLAAGPVLLQLAAYEHLWREAHPKETLDLRTLQLRPNGTYKLRPLDTGLAWRVFQLALVKVRGERPLTIPEELMLLDYQDTYGRAKV